MAKKPVAPKKSAPDVGAALEAVQEAIVAARAAVVASAGHDIRAYEAQFENATRAIAQAQCKE